MNLDGYSAINSSLARIGETERLRQAEADRATRLLRREAREARSASRIAALLRRKNVRAPAPVAPVASAPVPEEPAPVPEGLVPQQRVSPEASPAPVET